MTAENLSTKESKYLRELKSRTSNVHVLPFIRKKSAPKKNEVSLETEKQISEFANLSAKLEARLNKIESNLRESVELLEDDLHVLLKSKKLQKDESSIHKEIESLSHQLEKRVKETLNILSRKDIKNKENFTNIEMIKSLSKRLTKVISFGFYRDVLERLKKTEYQEEVDPFGMDKHFIEKIKPLFDYLYYQYWRVTTTGVENIPHQGRALIVGNHSGTVPYDGSMIKCAILNEHSQRKDARFLVEDFVYHMPFLGSLMYRIGGVRACPENAEHLLKNEHLVVVFPEGVKGIGKYFNQRYQLQRFGRGGFIRLCMKTKSPLIPVGVVGAEEIHPIIYKSNVLAKTIGIPYLPITPTFPLLGLLGCIPFPTKWYIHFGKPIYFDHHPPEAMNDDLLIHKLSEEVRDNIQNIIRELLKKRSSVWL